jgi:UDP-glucose 4-epimerase
MFFREALAGRPLTIHGDGGQTRDFIHVRDIAAALEFVATQPGLTGVFNAGYGHALTVRELASEVLALTGSRSEIVFAPSRAGDVRHSCADVSRLRAAGFRPEGSVVAGLRDLHAALVRASESKVSLR